MTEATLLGVLGFAFVCVGVIVLALAIAGLLGAGIASIVVGLGLGFLSTL